MQGLVDGTISVTDTVVEHFDRCLGCMACVTACPAGVQYGTLIEQTRAYVEQEHERPPESWLLRALVFATLPHPRRLRAALALAPAGRFVPMPGWLRPLVSLAPPWGASGVAPPEVTPAEGERRARVGLLAGCVQSVIFGSTNVATTRALAADGCEVVVPPGQVCCGALHLHAGRAAEGHERARGLADLFRAARVDAIVVNAAGCGSHLKDSDLDVRVLDVSELLAELGPRAERKPLELSVAFQDSCHLLHAQRLQEQPRDALRAIPGLELREPAEQAICCGSAGIYNLVQPQAAGELGTRKAQHVRATGADVYASANPGCLVQVSAALRRAGRPLPAVHPIELVDASIRGLSRENVLGAARR
jgi:glycolate oxidase iron-sulfur subunit